MAIVRANLFIVARISSVKKSITVEFQERRPPQAAGKAAAPKLAAGNAVEPNHLMLGLYSKKSGYDDLMHNAFLRAPLQVLVDTGRNLKPTHQQLRAAALPKVKLHFPNRQLSAMPTTNSYWTGTYWIKPKQSEFTAGFQFQDAKGDPIEGNLRIQGTNNKPALLRMDFVAVVQSL